LSESLQFKHQYALFWKSIFVLDFATAKKITDQWGVLHPEIMASACLQSVVSFNTGIKEEFSRETLYKTPQQTKKKILNLIDNTKQLPSELVIVGRNCKIY
jgi:aarF domain-containing kinase